MNPKRPQERMTLQFTSPFDPQKLPMKNFPG
nr:MAG TPA: hypothetical protein [Caudoviricetes sp.]DAW23707.1 MAG TPA: hypothetical protein [Caudoviricetes sp.]